MPIVRSVQLFFQEGSSDKVYHATLIEEDDGSHSVEVEWGRRGSKLSRGRKANKVTLAKAEQAYDKLVREKTAKGYEAISDAVQPAEVAPPEGQGSGSRATGVRAKVGQAAQLLNPIEEDELPGLLADARVVAQQKLDGNRVLVHVGDEIVATNRAGQRTNLHDSIAAALEWVPQGSIVDGELVSGDAGPIYWLFDALQIAGEDLRELGYVDRWQRLDAEIEPVVGPGIRVLEYAEGHAEKRDLYQRLRDAKAEGIVFKQRDAPYEPGRPSSGGKQLKHKFVKTADVVLTENAGNAYRMAVHAGTTLQDIGKVFSGTTNEIRETLDARLAAGEQVVAEVRYLYATDDEQLYQPVFVRLRSDKQPHECTIAQLEKTRRDVHEV